MTANPYSAPSAEVKDPPSPPWSPVKSILLGLAIDIGGSLIIGMVLGIIYAITLTASGMKPDDIRSALENISLTSWVSIAGILLGSACSFFGGVACARVSHSSNYKLGIILGVISSTIGFLFFMSHRSPVKDVIMIALTFACIMFGTKYGISKNARELE